jgi:hypothetical protein
VVVDVGVPPAVVHLDEPHAVLDEPPGQEAAVAEVRPAVPLAQLVGLLRRSNASTALLLIIRTASSYRSEYARTRGWS